MATNTENDTVSTRGSFKCQGGFEQDVLDVEERSATDQEGRQEFLDGVLADMQARILQLDGSNQGPHRLKFEPKRKDQFDGQMKRIIGCFDVERIEPDILEGTTHRWHPDLLALYDGGAYIETARSDYVAELTPTGGESDDDWEIRAMEDFGDTEWGHHKGQSSLQFLHRAMDIAKRRILQTDGDACGTFRICFDLHQSEDFLKALEEMSQCFIVTTACLNPSD